MSSADMLRVHWIPLCVISNGAEERCSQGQERWFSVSSHQGLHLTATALGYGGGGAWQPHQQLPRGPGVRIIRSHSPVQPYQLPSKPLLLQRGDFAPQLLPTASRT